MTGEDAIFAFLCRPDNAKKWFRMSDISQALGIDREDLIECIKPMVEQRLIVMYWRKCKRFYRAPGTHVLPPPYPVDEKKDAEVSS